MSSSTVSPFMRSAVRNAAICALVAAPDMMASIAAAASMRVRSRRSTRARTASVMIGLVMTPILASVRRPMKRAHLLDPFDRPASAAEVGALDGLVGEELGGAALEHDRAVFEDVRA